MTNNKNKAQFQKIGSVKQSKKGSFYISLGDNVTILVDGKPVAGGGSSLNLQSPVESKTRLLKSGKAKDPEKLKAEIEDFTSGKLAYIKFDIFSTPSSNGN